MPHAQRYADSLRQKVGRRSHRLIGDERRCAISGGFWKSIDSVLEADTDQFVHREIKTGATAHDYPGHESWPALPVRQLGILPTIPEPYEHERREELASNDVPLH
jgi:hypothetical protein